MLAALFLLVCAGLGLLAAWAAAGLIWLAAQREWPGPAATALTASALVWAIAEAREREARLSFLFLLPLVLVLAVPVATRFERGERLVPYLRATLATWAGWVVFTLLIQTEAYYQQMGPLLRGALSPGDPHWLLSHVQGALMGLFAGAVAGNLAPRGGWWFGAIPLLLFFGWLWLIGPYEWRSQELLMLAMAALFGGLTGGVKLLRPPPNE